MAEPSLALPLLSDLELEEFRDLARKHAGATLTTDQARSATTQLLRILAIVRDVAVQSSSDSPSSVDGQALPDSPVRAITTYPPA
jgi:hypothetical protein